MRYYIFLLVMLGGLLWTGCDDSETLVPSTGLEEWFSLPQGEHDYDSKIVDWFERCGFYILYKFDPKDVYASIRFEWEEARADTSWFTNQYTMGGLLGTATQDGDKFYLLDDPGVAYVLGEQVVDGLQVIVDLSGDVLTITRQKLQYDGLFSVNQADEKYAGKQLAWFEEMFLDFYPDVVLRQKMPIKVILGKDLELVSGKTKRTESFYSSHFNTLVLNYGDESIENLANNMKLKCKVDLHKWFLKLMSDQIYAAVEESGFFSVSNYTAWKEAGYSYEELYPLGVLKPNTGSSGQQQTDLEHFLNMILSTSFTTLTAEPASGNYDAGSYKGILHVKKDVNGLIKKKYDILVKVMKEEFGIYIQAIGDLYN